MADYTGIRCPICNEPFKPEDDIVVCPYCGAPYHRSCFDVEGKCVYQDKHGVDDFKWENPESASKPGGDAAAPAGEESYKICPRCSHRNNYNALFCDNCGFAFSEKESPEGQPVQGQIPFARTAIPFIFDPLGGVDPNENYDGITASEMGKYVKVSAQYYLPEFKKIKDKKPSRFNFAAFIFSGGWLLYRKQYAWGTVLSLVLAVVLVASTVLDLLFNEAILSQAMANSGVTNSASGLSSLLNAQNLQNISAQISALPTHRQVFFYLPVVLYFIQFVMMIVVGLNANRMYMKHCIKTIKKIRAKGLTTQNFEKELDSSGGVNTALAMVLLLCYIMINYIPIFIL